MPRKSSPNRKMKRDFKARYERLQKKRKIASASVDPQMIANILKMGINYKVKAEGVPADAISYGWNFDALSNTVLFIFGHEDFKALKQGEDMPRLEWKLTRIDDEKRDGSDTAKSD